MDFLELSEKRFTAKKFDPSKSISAEDFDKLKKILQLAPSSVNSQPWIFLTGSSEEAKKTYSSRSCRFQLASPRYVLTLCPDRCSQRPV